MLVVTAVIVLELKPRCVNLWVQLFRPRLYTCPFFHRHCLPIQETLVSIAIDVNNMPV